MGSRRALLVFLLASLVVGLVWVLWDVPWGEALSDGPNGIGKQDAANPEDEVTLEGLASDQAAGRRQALTPVKPGERTEPEEYQKALGGLRGRLIWKGSGKPIVGVEVALIEAWLDAVVPSLEDLAGLSRRREPVLLKGRDHTNSEGIFQIPGVHSRALLLLAIGLQTDKAAIRLLDSVPAPGETVDLGDVALLERGRVTGQVVDEEDKPVAGARVRIADLPGLIFQLGMGHYDPRGLVFIKQGTFKQVLPLPPWTQKYDKLLPFGDVETDSEGRFEVLGLRPGESVAIVTKPGLEPATRRLRVRADEETSLATIRLGEGEVLSGRFVKPGGKPISAVQVTAGSQMSLLPFGFLGQPTEVDAKGSFEITGLGRGSLWLAYRRARGEPWMVHGPHLGGDDVEIVVRERGSGTISVQNEQGNPIEKVHFALVSVADSSYLPSFEPRVDLERHLFPDQEKKGLWHLRGLPAGKYQVTAKAEGYALGTARLEIGKATDAKPHVSIQLVAAHLQRFVARNLAGKAVAGARIYWRPSESKGPSGTRGLPLSKLPVLLGRSNTDGVLETDAIVRGASSFFCRHPAYALAGSGEQQAGGGEPIRFVLLGGGDVEGVLARNGAVPGRRFSIMAEPRGDLLRHHWGLMMPRFTWSKPDGSFGFKHLDPGRWQIGVVPEYGEMASPAELLKLGLGLGQSRSGPKQEIEVREAEVSWLRLELAAAKESKGRGRIVGSVQINGRPAVGVQVGTWAGRCQAIVGASGRFLLEGLPDGEVWIGVERAGQGGMLAHRLWEGRVQIQDGSQESLHLSLRVARIRIQVSDRQGQPIGGLLLELEGKTTTRGEIGERQGGARIHMVTDADGMVSHEDIPEGRYRVQTLGSRDASWVLPVSWVEAVASDKSPLQRLQAIRPLRVEGLVILDLEELGEEEEKALAHAGRPTYLVLVDSGRYIWGPVRRRGGNEQFSISGAAPGSYRLAKGGRLGWTSSELVLVETGGRRLRLVLRPDRSLVQKELARRKKAGKKAGK